MQDDLNERDIKLSVDKRSVGIIRIFLVKSGKQSIASIELQ